jgi:hypothetical protein
MSHALPPHLYFGLDLGQRRDPSALALVERVTQVSETRDPVTLRFPCKTHFALRHLARFPLGTPYLSIVRAVRDQVQANTSQLYGQFAAGPGSSHNPYKTVAVDASGLGVPVVELLRHARLGCEIVPITITAAGKPHRNQDGHFVPRRDLVCRFRVLLELGLVRIPASLPLRHDLTRELLSFSDHPGSASDDLAIATALALWQSSSSVPGLPL